MTRTRLGSENQLHIRLAQEGARGTRDDGRTETIMTVPSTSIEVRSRIVDTFRRDLVGPGPQDLQFAKERAQRESVARSTAGIQRVRRKSAFTRYAAQTGRLNAAAFSFIRRPPERRAPSADSSEPRRDSRRFSEGHWNDRGSVPTIRSAPITSPTTAAAIGRPTAPPATAAC